MSYGRCDTQFYHLAICFWLFGIQFWFFVLSSCCDGCQLLLLLILRKTLYNFKYSMECQLLSDGLLWCGASAFDGWQLTFASEYRTMWFTVGFLQIESTREKKSMPLEKYCDKMNFREFFTYDGNGYSRWTQIVRNNSTASLPSTVAGWCGACGRIGDVDDFDDDDDDLVEDVDDDILSAKYFCCISWAEIKLT